jgi:hypothetical protein
MNPKGPPLLDPQGDAVDDAQLPFNLRNELRTKKPHSLRRETVRLWRSPRGLGTRIRSDRVALRECRWRRGGWVWLVELDVAARQHACGQHVSIGKRDAEPVAGARFAVPTFSARSDITSSSSIAAVAKYMVRNRRPPSQTWKTFLKIQIQDNGFEWARKMTLVMKSRENSLVARKRNRFDSTLNPGPSTARQFSSGAEIPHPRKKNPGGES